MPEDIGEHLLSLLVSLEKYPQVPAKESEFKVNFLHGIQAPPTNSTVSLTNQTASLSNSTQTTTENQPLTSSNTTTTDLEKPGKEVPMNITRISDRGQMTIGIDTPVFVPDNFTDLDKTLFDIWYIPNSANPSAEAQNFTFNMTDFSSQLIRVDLFFSDPMYVSVDTILFDEVVVRCYKTLFAPTISHEKDFRDLHWDYN